MTSTNLPKSSHTDCSHNYGAESGAKGLATLTIAYFVVAGLVHKAVRFWRHDFKTGAIEIYTLEPYSAEHTQCTELGWNTFAGGDFLRYANDNEPSKTDLAALTAIAAADPTYHSLHADQAARYAAMEF